MKSFRWLFTLAILAGLYGGAYLHGQQPPMLMYGVDTATRLTHPIKVGADGALGITATITGADGAITDGVTAGTRATVVVKTNSNPLATMLVDANGTQITSFGGGTQYTHNVGLTVATTIGTMAVGRASAAAPASASGDDVAVLPWYLRSGAIVEQPSYGGVLGMAGNGVSGPGVPRVTIASDTTGVLAVTQSGTWTVQPGNTANTTAWKVDGSAVTQPISVASIPSHAVTNAGTFAVQAAESGTWTVQPGNTANTTAWLMAGGKTNNNTAPGATNLGVLSVLANASAPTWTEGNLVALSADLTGALRISGGGGGGLGQGSTTASQVGTLIMAAVTTAAPSYTTAQTSPLSLTTAGSLRVDVMNGGAGGLTVADNATFTDNTSSLTPGGGVAEFASPTACAEGKYCAAGTTLNRALKVTLYDTSGVAITPNADITHNVAVSASGPQQMLSGSSTLPTAVTTGNAVRAWAGLNGQLAVMLVDSAGTAMSPRAATATLTNVSASASSVTVVASNTARKGVTIFNDSSAIAYVKFGSTASTTSFTYKLQAGDNLELLNTVYTGIVTAIWDAATGTARITELT